MSIFLHDAPNLQQIKLLPNGSEELLEILNTDDVLFQGRDSAQTSQCVAAPHLPQIKLLPNGSEELWANLTARHLQQIKLLPNGSEELLEITDGAQTSQCEFASPTHYFEFASLWPAPSRILLHGKLAENSIETQQPIEMAIERAIEMEQHRLKSIKLSMEMAKQQHRLKSGELSMEMAMQQHQLKSFDVLMEMAMQQHRLKSSELSIEMAKQQHQLKSGELSMEMAMQQHRLKPIKVKIELPIKRAMQQQQHQIQLKLVELPIEREMQQQQHRIQLKLVELTIEDDDEWSVMQQHRLKLIEPPIEDDEAWSVMQHAFDCDVCDPCTCLMVVHLCFIMFCQDIMDFQTGPKRQSVYDLCLFSANTVRKVTVKLLWSTITLSSDSDVQDWLCSTYFSAS